MKNRVELDNIWRERYGQHNHKPERTVVAQTRDYAHGERQMWHSHVHGQLVYASRGVVRVLTAEGAWTLSPHCGLWVAPGLGHEVHMIGPVSLRSLYIEPSAVPWIWQECRAIAVDLLLAELVQLLAAQAAGGGPDTTAALALPLLLRRLQEAPCVDGGRLPLPRDKRLLKVCETLLREPSRADTLETWSDRAGASARTLGRLFKMETGLTFGQWRQQLRVTEAICQLALGKPLPDVAGELGYADAHSFSNMFKRVLGETPGRYMKPTTELNAYNRV
jgi:AraC-like DNA-binding protein